jgi:hypothetical protein
MMPVLAASGDVAHGDVSRRLPNLRLAEKESMPDLPHKGLVGAD